MDIGLYMCASPNTQFVAPLMGLARVSHLANRDSEWSLYMYCYVYLLCYRALSTLLR